MVEFPESLYLPGPDEPAGVLTWGKSPAQTKEDLDAAVARIGGWRRPNYGQAYLLGANTLLRKAREDGHLDHHALPIFYLQRHSAELLMKEVLQFSLEIHDLCHEMGQQLPSYPRSKRQRDRVGHEHDLALLLNDLEEMSQAMQVGTVPDSLRSALRLIATIEDDPTWARYAFRAAKEKGAVPIQHTANEVVVPLGDIQDLLQRANQELGVTLLSPGLLLGNLVERWQDLMRQADRIG